MDRPFEVPYVKPDDSLYLAYVTEIETAIEHGLTAARAIQAIVKRGGRLKQVTNGVY
jgi:hypothetical protein